MASGRIQYQYLDHPALPLARQTSPPLSQYPGRTGSRAKLVHKHVPKHVLVSISIVMAGFKGLRVQGPLLEACSYFPFWPHQRLKGFIFRLHSKSCVDAEMWTTMKTAREASSDQYIVQDMAYFNALAL